MAWAKYQGHCLPSSCWPSPPLPIPSEQEHAQAGKWQERAYCHGGDGLETPARPSFFLFKPFCSLSKDLSVGLPQGAAKWLGGHPGEGDVNSACSHSFYFFHGLVLLTGSPQIFMFFSLVSDLKVLKVKAAILGLPFRFFLPKKGRGSKYGSLLLVLLILKNHTAKQKVLVNASIASAKGWAECHGDSESRCMTSSYISVLRAKTEYLNQERGALPGSFSIMRCGLCIVRSESGGCCQDSKYCGWCFLLSMAFWA